MPVGRQPEEHEFIGRFALAFSVALSLAAGGCTLICDTAGLRENEDLLCEGGSYQEEADLCWQHPGSEEVLEWSEAIERCDKLDLAGHTDWYLPNRQEFEALLGGCEEHYTESSYCDTCDESDTCNALFGRDDYIYWSSSEDDPGDAWAVDFATGMVIVHDKWQSNDVRCVRQGK